MYKDVIEAMNTLQESRLRSVTLKGTRLDLVDGPPTKQDGLYWIYTQHTNAEFLVSTPSTKRASVDFRRLVARHASLQNICTRSADGFRLVYNGIGGLGPKGHGGLRERILGEFRGGNGTGSLAIRGSSLSELQYWRYSYILWSEINFPGPHTYSGFSESIERLWRIHYGWPLLCHK